MPSDNLVTAFLLYLIVLACLAATGCETTPQYWSQEEHVKMLGACRAACGSGRVASYDAMSGECSCFVGRKAK